MREYLGTTTPAPIRDKYRTPPYVFKAFDDEFHFDKDVAASDDNHLVADYITEEMDALDLATPWGKFNWCNPPYSDIDPWVLRAAIEKDAGNSTAMLIPADTSTGWFLRAWISCDEVRFVSGRLAFLNAETGLPAGNNNKGSVLFVWHGNKKDGRRKVSLVHRNYLKKLGALDNDAAA